MTSYTNAHLKTQKTCGTIKKEAIVFVEQMHVVRLLASGAFW